MTAHVCREHPDQPVTWRGTGCVECERERRRSERTHNRGRDDDAGEDE